MEVDRLPANIEFRDATAAARNLAEIRHRIPAESFGTLLRILGESPDPDAVVLLVARLIEVPQTGVAAMLAAQPSLLHYACLIFGHSYWLGEALIQNTDLLGRFGGREDLDRCLSREEFREEFARTQSRSSREDLPRLLAHFRKREYVRILLRDLLGIANLTETTGEISALADALIAVALEAADAGLQHRLGKPQWVDGDGCRHDSRVALVSLGKLGGNELNYSSDVDLLFLYDGGTDPPDAMIPTREYFIRVAQQTTEILSARTREGQAFRIDLRLRPQGHAGELAVALSRAIQYYSEVAEDWELQAMIKARHSAGDASLTREFILEVEPYVYRASVNFAAVKTALQTRERIDKRRGTEKAGRTPPKATNVKLDRGGIRDIEFLVQCLQRVYGGEERWLRSRGTLFALQKLHDKEHISGKDFHVLTKAYEFLRNLEHHLQLGQGRQSHQLPTQAAELKVLARRLSSGESRSPSPDEFVAEVRSRMAAVAEIYRRIVYREQGHQFVDEDGNLRLLPLASASAENSYSLFIQRLAMDAPRLMENLGRTGLSQHARRNLDRFFNSASTSSERYGAVLRSPEAVEAALTIFESSEYLTDILVRHPADIELLREFRGHAESQAPALLPLPERLSTDSSDPIFRYLANSEGDRLEAQCMFRQHFRRELFVTNAASLYRRRNILEILRENSDAADSALSFALAVAQAPAGFAVMALGRLGSREFDVLSDADVLFVSDESTDRWVARTAAERMMAFLTTYTRDGMFFPVDPRLRPSGSDGELVTTPAHLRQYFSHEAKPWEAITYLRLRFVAGSEEVGNRAVEAVRAGIASVGLKPEFSKELGEMRQRLEAVDPGRNIKTGPGGSYDIDFLTGRMQAQHSVWEPGTLCERLATLSSLRLIVSEDARMLSENAEFLRMLEHSVRLVTGQPAKWLPSGEHALATVAKLMRGAPMYETGKGLEGALQAVLRQTREVFLKYPF
jgi:glutamate-ammonia-ligase adenylyltransferase